MATNALRSEPGLGRSCTGSPTEPRYWLEAWAYSSLLHAVLFALALGFVTSLRLPPDPLLFRLEVALTETPVPSADVAPSQSQPSPSRPVADRPEMTPPPQARPAAVETRPTVNSVTRESSTAIERTQPLETAQAVQSTQPIVRQETKAITALPRETVSSTAASVQHTDSPVDLPLQKPDAVVRESSTQTSEGMVVSHAATRELSPARESQVVASSTPVIRERQVILHNEPVVSSSSSLEKARVETHTAISRPSVEAKAIAPPTKPSEIASAGTTKQATSSGTSRSKPSFVNIEATPARSTSFGWLAEAIKRSERQRRPVADHEGTTRFHITMRQDGLTVNLLELSIAESSGYPQVDRAAADLIRRAFPIELTERLAKSQVRVEMPVTIHTN